MDKMYLSLNDIEAYRIAYHLSNKVWNIVLQWEQFSRNTTGQQFVRAIDSVSANIAERFGRFGKKDKIRFYRYASGSVYKCLYWNEKAKERKLLSPENYDFIFQELKKLPKAINALIKYTNEKLSI
ncbi:four helix bundle protein [Catalinimonas sp. 4WD22]|uniref:four helix bundle protein n=1 Tax=Catalinimonas locisalis TaxID=3133978 RepID=UPI003101853C